MNVNVALSEDLSAFVESQIADGRFASSNEVVLEALQLLRSMDAMGAYTTEELRTAWQVGIDSGDAGDIDFAELKREARARLRD